MRTVLSLAVAFLLTAAGGLARAQVTDKDWKLHESRSCACSILMPGSPKESQQTYPTDAGDVVATLFILELEGGSVAYLLGYNDYKAELVASSDPQVMLDGARDGAVSNVSGKLISEKKITLDGNPGRELKIEAPQDNVVFARVYMVKQRLYQALVVMPKSKLRDGEVKKFLGSFKLLRKK
jgi:hypothetical protein